MIVDILLDSFLIIFSIPLLLATIYIYKKTNYNSMLVLFGASITIISAHLLEISAITGPIIQGVYWFPVSFVFLVIPFIIAYYLIQDNMWTLLAILATMSITLTAIVTIHGIATHGVFSLPTAIILWAWYKETDRCFNPIACPLYRLERKYL